MDHQSQIAELRMPETLATFAMEQQKLPSKGKLTIYRYGKLYGGVKVITLVITPDSLWA